MKNYLEHSKRDVDSQCKNMGLMQVRHFHFPKIDSTNTWAKLNLERWSVEGMTLVTASEQTQGRGRFNRSWVSPKDRNIYASFCIFLNELRQDDGQIPQLLAFSAMQVLASYGIISTIKWPNDLLVEGKKIAGILCETTRYENKTGIICGIGLNVNMTSEEISGIDQPACSMFIAKDHLFSVEEVTERLILTLVENWQVFACQTFHPFFNKFRNCSHYQTGDEIYVVDGLKRFAGKFMQLNEDGSMSILLPNEEIKICSSGEIWEKNRPFYI